MKKQANKQIRQLISAARKIWRYSPEHRLTKARYKDPKKSGWYWCSKCPNYVEVLKVDHIKPIGKQPTTWKEFGTWLPKLFCSVSNLQGLCNACHKEKTKQERKKK